MEVRKEDHTHKGHADSRLKERVQRKEYHDRSRLHYPTNDNPQSSIRPIRRGTLTSIPSERLLELACPKWPFFTYCGTEAFRFITRDRFIKSFGGPSDVLYLMPTLKQIEANRPGSTTFLPYERTLKKNEPRLVRFRSTEERKLKKPCPKLIKNLAQPRPNRLEVQRKKTEHASTVSKAALKAVPSSRIIALARPKIHKYQELRTQSTKKDKGLEQGSKRIPIEVMESEMPNDDIRSSDKDMIENLFLQQQLQVQTSTQGDISVHAREREHPGNIEELIVKQQLQVEISREGEVPIPAVKRAEQMEYLEEPVRKQKLPLEMSRKGDMSACTEKTGERLGKTHVRREPKKFSTVSDKITERKASLNGKFISGKTRNAIDLTVSEISSKKKHHKPSKIVEEPEGKLTKIKMTSLSKQKEKILHTMISVESKSKSTTQPSVKTIKSPPQKVPKSKVETHVQPSLTTKSSTELELACEVVFEEIEPFPDETDFNTEELVEELISESKSHSAVNASIEMCHEEHAASEDHSQMEENNSELITERKSITTDDLKILEESLAETISNTIFEIENKAITVKTEVGGESDDSEYINDSDWQLFSTEVSDGNSDYSLGYKEIVKDVEKNLEFEQDVNREYNYITTESNNLEDTDLSKTVTSDEQHSEKYSAESEEGDKYAKFIEGEEFPNHKLADIDGYAEYNDITTSESNNIEDTDLSKTVTSYEQYSDKNDAEGKGREKYAKFTGGEESEISLSSSDICGETVVEEEWSGKETALGEKNSQDGRQSTKSVSSFVSRNDILRGMEKEVESEECQEEATKTKVDYDVTISESNGIGENDALLETAALDKVCCGIDYSEDEGKKEYVEFIESEELEHGANDKVMSEENKYEEETTDGENSQVGTHGTDILDNDNSVLKMRNEEEITNKAVISTPDGHKKTITTLKELENFYAQEEKERSKHQERNKKVELHESETLLTELDPSQGGVEMEIVMETTETEVGILTADLTIVEESKGTIPIAGKSDDMKTKENDHLSKEYEGMNDEIKWDKNKSEAQSIKTVGETNLLKGSEAKFIKSIKVSGGYSGRKLSYVTPPTFTATPQQRCQSKYLLFTPEEIKRLVLEASKDDF